VAARRSGNGACPCQRPDGDRRDEQEQDVIADISDAVGNIDGVVGRQPWTKPGRAAGGKPHLGTDGVTVARRRRHH